MKTWRVLGLVAGVMLGGLGPGDRPGSDAGTAAGTATPVGETVQRGSGADAAARRSDCPDLGACEDVTCVASDGCHVAGICDPSTGLCSNPGVVGVPGCGPTLYADPEHEGPVRGAPGDVLLLAGTDFDLAATVVVYELFGNPTPTALPALTTKGEGTITPLSIDANAVTVLLPEIMRPGRAYELWAATPDPAYPGQYLFSNGVLINDARPMWMSPGPRAGDAQSPYPYVYTTADRPGLGRTVAIMGRNLDPAPTRATQVRFTAPGASPITLYTTPSPDPAVDRYAAEVSLPAMPLVNGAATNYAVELSRDSGGTWVPLATPLAVLPDPPALPTTSATCPLPRSPGRFYPGDYADAENACDPCDAPTDPGSDDTLCITRAIHAAEQYVAQHPSAVATVVIPAPACANGRDATWIVAPGHLPLFDPAIGPGYLAATLLYGIVVPPGVNLVADPCAATQPTIETEQAFDQPVFDDASASGTCGVVGACCDTDSDCCSSGRAQVCAREPPGCSPGCTAGGRCEVRGPDLRQWLFQLQGDNLVQGLHIRDAYQPTLERPAVPGGCITPIRAPGGSGILVSGNDVTLTGNWLDDTYLGVSVMPGNGLLPDGESGNMDVVITGNQLGAYLLDVVTLLVEDSVISNNTFWPGAAPPSYDAPIAIGVGGSRRLSVSGNTLDGSTAPEATAYSGAYTGWRAGMFFPLESSHEDVLVARNTILCSGMRPYVDGEAIAFDANGAGPSLQSSEPVAAAPPPTPTQVSIAWPGSEDLSSALPPSSAVGRWLLVDHGPGVGQTRKIVAVSAPTTTLTFTVSPAFDVAPVAGPSRVLVLDQTWQANIVGNVIDDSVPRCFPPAPEPPDLTNLPAGSAGIIELYGASADVAIDSNVQTDAAGIYAFSMYGYGTSSAAPGPLYYFQTPQYFVDVRGNSIQGQLGGAGNPGNMVGAGIALAAFSGTLRDGVPQANPNWPGFGLSVSHNTLSDAAITSYGLCLEMSAGIVLAPIQAFEESTSPAWVDTLVFGNALGGTTASASLPYSAAILNGCYHGVPNYPSGTVVCKNQYSSFASLCGDWPAPGETSTLITACGP